MKAQTEKQTETGNLVNVKYENGVVLTLVAIPRYQKKIKIVESKYGWIDVIKNGEIICHIYRSGILEGTLELEMED